MTKDHLVRLQLMTSNLCVCCRNEAATTDQLFPFLYNGKILFSHKKYRRI